MSNQISIEGIDKAELLAALYNKSRPLGLNFLHATKDDMTVHEAREIIKDVPSLYFDYLRGRVMKVSLADNTFDPWFYDRDVGQGAAQSVVDAIREGQNAPKNESSLADDLEATLGRGFGLELTSALERRRGDFGASIAHKGGVAAYFPEEKERVTANMNMLQVLFTLSEGSPASMETLIDVSKAVVKIDPYSMPLGEMDFMFFLNVDSLGLYGRNVTALHKICENDPEKTATVIRGWQLGFVAKEDIQTNVAAVLDGAEANLDVNGIIKKVQNRIDGYKRIIQEKPQQALAFTEAKSEVVALKEGGLRGRKLARRANRIFRKAKRQNLTLTC